MPTAMDPAPATPVRRKLASAGSVSFVLPGEFDAGSDPPPGPPSSGDGRTAGAGRFRGPDSTAGGDGKAAGGMSSSRPSSRGLDAYDPFGSTRSGFTSDFGTSGGGPSRPGTGSSGGSASVPGGRLADPFPTASSTQSGASSATSKRTRALMMARQHAAEEEIRRKAKSEARKKARRKAKLEKAYGLPPQAESFGHLPMTFVNEEGETEILSLLSLSFRLVIDKVIIRRQNLRRHGLTVRRIVSKMNNYLQRKFLSELMNFGILTSQKLRKHLALNDWIQDVRQLHLPDFDLKAADLSLILFVTKMARYKSVDLRGNPISGPQISYIAPIIQKSWLTRLTLKNTRITCVGALVLASAIPETSIEWLDLCNANLGIADFTHNSVEYDSQGIVKLLGVLTTKESLTALDVSCNALFGVRWEAPAGAFIGELDKDALRAWARLVYKNRGLVHVYASYNAIGGYYNDKADLVEAGPPATYVLRGYTVNANNVAMLEMAHTGLRYTGADSVAEMLTHNRSLTYVDLRGNTMGFLGFQVLARSLYTQPTLTYLNLQSNKGRCEGVASLCAALEHNDTLLELDLSYNDIREAGAIALTTMVERNRGIRKLHLQVNRFGPMGAFPLLEAIGYSRQLVEVNCSDVYMYASKMFDPSLVPKNRYVNLALSKMCEETSSLRFFDGRRNYIPDTTKDRMRKRVHWDCNLLM